MSTSRGIMSGKEARKNHYGGEVLCYIWWVSLDKLEIRDTWN
jgi:hypothetical protein